MLSLVFGSILAGLTVQKIGWYTPFAMVGVCIMSVGSGLLYTLQVNTGKGKWIGYQIIYGFGMGLCFQQPNLAAQTVVAMTDVPSAVALMFFAQLLGAAIFVPVGENILGNELLKRLPGKVSVVTPSLVTSQGITSLLDSLPEEMREIGVVAYKEALRQVFLLGLVLSCLSVIGASALELKSTLKKHGHRLINDEANEEKGNRE
jgi:MFS family permease